MINSNIVKLIMKAKNMLITLRKAMNMMRRISRFKYTSLKKIALIIKEIESNRTKNQI
jgi:hypothetical protein